MHALSSGKSVRDMVSIQPIQPKVRVDVLTAEQVSEIRTATLQVLEATGVHFPSERALRIFAEHGADVDDETQIVRLPSNLVLEAMGHAPRSYTLSGRAEGTDLILDGASSYFATDGCGTETIDMDTGEFRASCKADVAMMARVADYLSSVAFYWPIVSAQDYGRFTGRLSALRITGDLDHCMSWMPASRTQPNMSRA